MSRIVWPPTESGRLIVISHCDPSTCILLTVKSTDVADDNVSLSMGKAAHCWAEIAICQGQWLLNSSIITLLHTNLCILYSIYSISSAYWNISFYSIKNTI